MDQQNSLCNKLCKPFKKQKQPKKVLLIGLDATGKTTILFQQLYGTICNRNCPSFGFYSEILEFKSTVFNIFDFGSNQNGITEEVEQQSQNAEAIIFVADSYNVRAELAKRELFRILEDDCLKNLPLLVFANKQDLKENENLKIHSGEELIEILGQSEIEGRDWTIQECSAYDGSRSEKSQIFIKIGSPNS